LHRYLYSYHPTNEDPAEVCITTVHPHEDVPCAPTHADDRPLSARPLVSTVEIFAGLDPRAVADDQSLVGMSAFTRGIWRVVIRVLTTVLFVLIAIIFPYFDRIMALLGSSMCFSICIILPLAFYLKLFGRQISLKERMLDYFLIVVCSIMAVIGTVWACLPLHTIEVL
jgi:vesicular inhibitory amino acid transporter